MDLKQLKEGITDGEDRKGDEAEAKEAQHRGPAPAVAGPIRLRDP